MWPSKEMGVTSRYVSDIERGVKHIQDVSLLRELAQLLDIPLWKLGLSEYNPFAEIDNISASFDEDMLEEIIKNTWLIRLSMPINIIKEKTTKLSMIFNRLTENNPLLQTNKGFLRLLAHTKRLQAVVLLEQKEYHAATFCFLEMLKIAEEIHDSSTLAIAHMSIGNELMRDGDFLAAFPHLENSHDLLFSFTPCKELTSLVSGMFARFYANTNNIKQFEKISGYAVNAASD